MLIIFKLVNVKRGRAHDGCSHWGLTTVLLLTSNHLTSDPWFLHL